MAVAKSYGVDWLCTPTNLENLPYTDIVLLAIPYGAREPYYKVLSQRDSALYVEKPMAATYEECLSMNEVSKQTGLPLFVAYYRRSMDYFLKVKELLSENAIGKPVLCHSQLFTPSRSEDSDKKNLRHAEGQ